MSMKDALDGHAQSVVSDRQSSEEHQTGSRGHVDRADRSQGFREASQSACVARWRFRVRAPNARQQLSRPAVSRRRSVTELTNARNASIRRFLGILLEQWQRTCLQSLMCSEVRAGLGSANALFRWMVSRHFGRFGTLQIVMKALRVGLPTSRFFVLSLHRIQELSESWHRAPSRS